MEPDRPAIPHGPDSPSLPPPPESTLEPPPAPAGGRGRRWGLPIGLAAAAVAALVAVALVLSTNGKDETSSGPGPGPGTDASPAPLVHRWSGDAVTIDLPQGWTAGAGSEGLPDALKQAISSQAAFADLLRLGGQAAGGTQVLMIMSTPRTPGLPSSALPDQLIAGLTGTTNAEVSAREETTVNGQPATRIEFAGVNAIVGVLSFTWADGSHDWVAIWIASTDSMDRWGSTYDAAMNSITTSGA